jgi:hypothetical protein
MAEAAPGYREKYGYLPAVLMLLLEVVGEDAMLKIAAELGGTRTSVGPTSRLKSPLERIVGARATDLIFERARRDGLLRLDIPRMGRTLELRRHLRVLRLRAEGTMIAEIALVLGMTERNIYYILADDRATPDPRQLALPF